MKFRLRRARRSDASGLLALERNFPTDRFSPRAIRYLLRARNAAVWVAEAGGAPATRRPARGAGAVVGAVVVLVRRRTRVARVYSLAVSRELRGRGLGAALLQAAEAEARRRGRAAMSLEVREDNRAARKLYASLRYVPVERLPRYYEDGVAALRLRKTL